MRRAALALTLGVLLCGCSAVPLGPVQRPEGYPDRTDHEAAFTTFLWAWHTGDVAVLDQVLGAWLHNELSSRLAAQGAEAVADYYRRGAEHLEVVELEWARQGEALAYLEVVLSSREVKQVRLRFSLLRRPDGWVVTGQRLLRGG